MTPTRQLRLLIAAASLALGSAIGMHAHAEEEVTCEDDTGVFCFSDCDLPCWMGLEVGVTTAEETDATLEQFEVTLTGETQRNFTVHDDLRGILNRDDEILTSLTLLYTGCPLQLVTELGEPDLVERGRRLEVLFYYREGIIVSFAVMFDYGQASIYLRDPDTIADHIDRDPTDRDPNRAYTPNERLSFDDPAVQRLLSSCAL